MSARIDRPGLYTEVPEPENNPAEVVERVVVDRSREEKNENRASRDDSRGGGGGIVGDDLVGWYVCPDDARILASSSSFGFLLPVMTVSSLSCNDV